MAILTKIVEAVAIRIAVDEVKAWLPWLNSKILSLAVSRLPCDQQERFREEWAADLESFPDGIARVARACGMVWAGWTVGGIIPERARAYARIAEPFLPELGLCVSGLTICGSSTWAAIWYTSHSVKLLDVRHCTVLGLHTGLCVASVIAAFIIQRRRKRRTKNSLSSDLNG